MNLKFYKKYLDGQIYQIRKKGFKIFIKKIFKLIFIIIKIPIYILSLFFFILIKLISPLLLIRVGRFRTAKLGHLSEEFEIYLCEKKLKINVPKKKYLDIFFKESSICNYFYYKLRRKDLIILPYTILHPLYILIKKFDKKKIHLCDRKHSAIDTFYVLDKSESTIKISEEIKNESLTILEKKGLKYKQKVICLHLRDSSYRGKNAFTDFRNIKNVNNYIKTIKYLTEKNYFVIRTGVVTKDKIKFKDPNYFDYSFSDIKSERMDVFLASHCYFCIANGSGFEPMVRSFRNPVLYTNFNKYSGYKSQHQNDMTIFLHIRDLNTNKKLTYSF